MSRSEKSRLTRIRITPVEYHSIQKGMHVNKPLLGYGHLNPDEIRENMALLLTYLKEQGHYE